MLKLEKEYDTYNSPDDVRLKPEALDFVRSYKQFNPTRVVDDEEGDIIEGPFEECPPVQDRDYRAPRAAPSLTVDDSHKFGSAPKYQ